MLIKEFFFVLNIIITTQIFMQCIGTRGSRLWQRRINCSFDNVDAEQQSISVTIFGNISVFQNKPNTENITHAENTEILVDAYNGLHDQNNILFMQACKINRQRSVVVVYAFPTETIPAGHEIVNSWLVAPLDYRQNPSRWGTVN